MMRIVLRYPTEDVSRLQPNSTIKQLVLGANGQNRLGELELRLPTEPGLYFLFAHAQFAVTESISVHNFYASRDGWAALQLNGVTSGSQVLALFYRREAAREKTGKDMTDSDKTDEDILLLYMPFQYEGTCEVADVSVRDETPLRLMQHYVPAGVIDVGAIRAKQWLVKRLSPLDSLSELEKQVDVLTHGLLHLLERLPASEYPAWADSLKTMMSECDATHEKGIAESLRAISTHKRRLRALQTEYFYRRVHNGIDCCDVCVPPKQ